MPGRSTELSGGGEGAGAESPTLFADQEIQAHAADLNEIAIVEANGTWNGSAVDAGRLRAGAEVITVVALIDLRSDLRLEPALQPHRSHHGLANDR